KGVAKGVGMSQLPAVRERAIGSSGGLIRIAAMPERPAQLNKGADPDVLPVAKGGIAVLVGPMLRRGGFGMRGGCTAIAAMGPTGAGRDEGGAWRADRKWVGGPGGAQTAPGGW